jgi:hypothetical protein
MRLINADTLKLEHFTVPPKYAILSHTWGKDEYTFEDAHNRTGDHKAGYEKVVNSCKRAARDGYGYIWVDTCCINKSSSAELSEAINSMFNWYRESSTCYAYINDFDQPLDEDSFLFLIDCKWFSRGWTLQELIAPPQLEFLGSQWQSLGMRHEWAEALSSKLNIDEWILERGLKNFKQPSARAMVSHLSKISISRACPGAQEERLPDQRTWPMPSWGYLTSTCHYFMAKAREKPSSGSKRRS